MASGVYTHIYTYKSILKWFQETRSVPGLKIDIRSNISSQKYLWCKLSFYPCPHKLHFGKNFQHNFELKLVIKYFAKVCSIWYSKIHNTNIDAIPSENLVPCKYCTHVFSTARFKLDAREYVLASANTFSSSSQWMLASKCYVLSCMILHAIKLNARVHYSSSVLRSSFNSRAKRSCEHEHHVTSILNMIACKPTFVRQYSRKLA